MMASSEPSQDSGLPSTDPLISPSSAPEADRPVGTRRGRPSLEEAQRIPLRILEAGWEVLRDHGFEAFTFDRVARHAHIGKATIYTRFQSKREFLEALLAHKTVQRRLQIMKIGVGLPIVEAFGLRAAAVMEVMHSAEGRMMERLVDWCDQEFGDGELNYRHAMYTEAIANLSSAIAQAASEQDIDIGDPDFAARLWLEGILGHARMESSSRELDRSANQVWARAYSQFFFAGLRGRDALTPPSERLQN